jgi:hypothetical protein
LTVREKRRLAVEHSCWPLALQERLEDALLDFRPKAAQCPQLSRLDGVAQACAVVYAEAVGEQLDPFRAKPG